jgi:hypothetical protein
LAFGFGAGVISSWRDPGNAKMFAAVDTAVTMSADVEEIESKITDPCSGDNYELRIGECQGFEIQDVGELRGELAHVLCPIT